MRRPAAEVEGLAAVAARSLGWGGPEAVEQAIRTAMARLGASLLEQLPAADVGYRGPRIDCRAGHAAEFVSYREEFVPSCRVVGVVAPGVGRSRTYGGQAWGGDGGSPNRLLPVVMIIRPLGA